METTNNTVSPARQPCATLSSPAAAARAGAKAVLWPRKGAAARDACASGAAEKAVKPKSTRGAVEKEMAASRWVLARLREAAMSAANWVVWDHEGASDLEESSMIIISFGESHWAAAGAASHSDASRKLASMRLLITCFLQRSRGTMGQHRRSG